jgi:hypothetical protein
MVGGVEQGRSISYALSLDGLSIRCRCLDRVLHWCSQEMQDSSFPSNQTTNSSLVNPARESNALALQRFRTAPGSIVAAGLELARLSRSSLFALEVCHERLVGLMIAANVASMRGYSPTISIGLELVRNILPERKTLIPGSPPAWYVRWRHCILAIGARSRLAAVGAGSDHDVRESAKKQVGVYAAGVRGSQSWWRNHYTSSFQACNS